MDIEKLVEEKRELCNERDLCAELYNVWITKLHDYQNVPEKYDLYMDLIQNMEPYGSELKSRIRQINQILCKHYGVNSIEDTPYFFECVSKYGNDIPHDFD